MGNELDRSKKFRIALWLLFGWGALCFGVFTYHSVLWQLRPNFTDGIGAVVAAFFGVVSWVGSPLVSFLARKQLSRKQLLVFNLPLMLFILVLVLTEILPKGTPEPFL
jgi:predicted MFS family arabinose efflux permease